MDKNNLDVDLIETQEWLDAFASLMSASGAGRASFIIEKLCTAAHLAGVDLTNKSATSLQTPFCNTVNISDQPDYPGDLELEKQIDAINRWNAMVMVLRAKNDAGGVGGHLSSYASIATLYEVGLNHFFRGSTQDQAGDLVYFQGHSSEGNYARAYLEGRLNESQLKKFRQEAAGDGISSYPHPWLMPDFWQFATVSLGLGPLQAIYQARFLKYLHNRDLLSANDRKVWVFTGDGEMDEVESIGALTVASREKLDNIIYVVNCNLQRLDGLVRGNGKIVQELEGVFHGAGWHVIKVLWDSAWDDLLSQDADGLLVKRLGEILDGELQFAYVEGGSTFRELLVKDSPKLQELLAPFSDEFLGKLGRGAHDSQKVFAAFNAAVKHTGQPVAILAQGVKGYGLGVQGAEGRNIAHNQLDMTTKELRLFCDRFSLPLTDSEIANLSFYRPKNTEPCMRYLQSKRQNLNGFQPSRISTNQVLEVPVITDFQAILNGSGERTQSTTMVLGRILNVLLKDKNLGQRLVPIFSDEVRTFGLESLFRQIGIYAPDGQKYQPEDRKQLVYYREVTDGQLLEEGITEAGCMASWIAAATSYSTHQLPMVPFFTYYSMFGFQRVGDLIWAAADMRARGFLIGATAGRTALEGEGLQHQDGSSLLTASTYPTCRAYDPAFGYEMAVIIQRGLQQMLQEQQDIFYYVMAMNEKYQQPVMPEGAEEGIIRGMYLFQKAKLTKKLTVQLLGSGTILREVIAAQKLLYDDFGVSANIWSVTSFSELRREGMAAERAAIMGKKSATPWVNECLDEQPGPVIAATDYVRALPDLIRPYLAKPFTVLGTDGFGRSDTRENLRDFFEVNKYHIVVAALYALSCEKEISIDKVQEARAKYGINCDKPNPWDV